MAALKYSRQREAVKEFLQSRTDHPTAETVYTCLRRTYPNISLGTVYRNLSLLADLGEISRISTGGDADHYDANLVPHQHFICTRCDRVYDICLEKSEHPFQLKALEEAAAALCPGQLKSCSIHFYGVCENCLKQRQNDNPAPRAESDAESPV